MDRKLLKLECLKLAHQGLVHLKPDETTMRAQAYLDFLDEGIEEKTSFPDIVLKQNW